MILKDNVLLKVLILLILILSQENLIIIQITLMIPSMIRPSMIILSVMMRRGLIIKDILQYILHKHHQISEKRNSKNVINFLQINKAKIRKNGKYALL